MATKYVIAKRANDFARAKALRLTEAEEFCACRLKVGERIDALLHKQSVIPLIEHQHYAVESPLRLVLFRSMAYVEYYWPEKGCDAGRLETYDKTHPMYSVLHRYFDMLWHVWGEMQFNFSGQRVNPENISVAVPETEPTHVGVERRRFPRLEEKLVLSYHALGGNEPRMSLTRNISGGGVCFPTEIRFPSGYKLALQIFKPTKTSLGGKLLLCVSARVVWTNEIQSAQWESGLEFINVKEKEQGEVIGYVNERLKQ